MGRLLAVTDAATNAETSRTLEILVIHTRFYLKLFVQLLQAKDPLTVSATTRPFLWRTAPSHRDGMSSSVQILPIRRGFHHAFHEVDTNLVERMDFYSTHHSTQYEQ